MSSHSIQNLTLNFASFYLEKQAQLPGARSRFFSKCGQYYDANSPMKSFLENDLFYRKARNLDQLFGHAPGSMLRLEPFKRMYINRWKDLRNTLQNGPGIFPDAELDKKVREFIIAHKHFVLKFIEETKTNRKDSSEAAEMNNPRMLKQFYLAIVQTALQMPDRAQEIFTLIEETDPLLFDFIPYQAILNSLDEPSQASKPQPHAPNPLSDNKPPETDQLLQSIAEPISAWREDYQKLEKTDQLSLRQAKPLLASKQNAQREHDDGLTEEAKRLFIQIGEGIYRCRNLDPVSFSAVFSRMFQFVSYDFSQAANLADCDVFKHLSEEISNENALLFLKNLPAEQYEKFLKNRRFPFLPNNQTDLNESCYQHRNFYRIVSIFSLAKELGKLLDKECERGDSNPQEENLTTTSK